MNTFLGELLGVISNCCLCFAFLPQTLMTLKTKNVEGLSLLSYIIYNFGIVMFIAYGFYLKSFQIMIFNSICEIFAFSMLYTVIKYKGKKQK